VVAVLVCSTGISAQQDWDLSPQLVEEEVAPGMNAMAGAGVSLANGSDVALTNPAGLGLRNPAWETGALSHARTFLMSPGMNPVGLCVARGLGIPDVIDRIVQEATRMSVEPLYEPFFHQNSHGFRPNRSCHTAMEQARTYVAEGYGIVVDRVLSNAHWENLCLRSLHGMWVSSR